MSGYGKTIPDVILSEEIKVFADYVNYLTKYRNSQPSVSTQGRGRRKGYMSKVGMEINVDKKMKKVEVPRKRRTIVVADNLLEDIEQALELVVLVNLEEERKRQEELMTKERHASLVIRKQVDEGFNSQMKLKLKVADTITPDTQLLLNLKKGSCESRESHILK
ncbi:hypothetical protein Tco_1468550 [Tanacetum coccineum]